jgi:hypothetical protein
MRDLDDDIMRFTAKWRYWTYRIVIREIVLWSIVLSLLANALLMFGFLAAAAYEGLLACLTFMGKIAPPAGFTSSSKAAITLGLRAVELVLLAPLGYVFVNALATFVQALAEQKPDENDGESRGEVWSRAFRVVVGVKSLAASLLISIIAVDFVGKILEERVFDVWQSLIGGMVFVMLVAYLITLEVSLHWSRAQRRQH